MQFPRVSASSKPSSSYPNQIFSFPKKLTRLPLDSEINNLPWKAAKHVLSLKLLLDLCTAHNSCSDNCRRTWDLTLDTRLYWINTPAVWYTPGLPLETSRFPKRRGKINLLTIFKQDIIHKLNPKLKAMFLTNLKRVDHVAPFHRNERMYHVHILQ